MKDSNLDLRNMDCMELMKEYGDNHFDLAIVDPPYGIDLANMGMGAGKSKKASKIENRGWKAKDWDKLTPTEEYFIELRRVSKQQVVWGGNYFELGACKHFIIWDKEIPVGLTFSDCEFAWTSFDGAQKMFRYSAYKNKSEKIHPTQKPPQLYKWLLQNYAKEGDKILDTHLGSGSIACACHDMHFDLVGSELDRDYFEAMQKRIKEHKMQLTLF